MDWSSTQRNQYRRQSNWFDSRTKKSKYHFLCTIKVVDTNPNLDPNSLKGDAKIKMEMFKTTFFN